ncbi:oligosaccharide flippase family protein [Xanthobacter sp. TB0139]|uniref:oligosaccharide flippase family protein n=1 Tax=Xanthobacter sp. TB0139 TaxID=3459178 RepID=UPI004039BCAD
MTRKIPSLASLIRNHWAFGAAMIVRGIELVGKLGLYMLTARVLGVFEAGLFFLCNTWVGLGATLARGGFEKAVMRHIAAELATGNGPEARRALLTGTLWTLAGGILVSLLTLLFARQLADHVFNEHALVHPLMIAAASILPQTLCIFVAHALTGFGRGVAGQFVQNGVWPVLTLAALAVGIHSLDGILYAFAFANLVGAVLGAVLLLPERRRFRVVQTGHVSTEKLPALWRTAWPLAIVEMSQSLLNSIPFLVLAVYATAEVMGAFSVASRITVLIWVVIIAISTIAAPSFAAAHRRGSWDELRAQNRKARLAIALFGVPAILVMMAVPTWLLHLIGPGFEIAATALVIMAVGQLINCLLPCQDVMLAMTGKGHILRWLSAAQLVTCFILCAILIPAFGMTGAALATTIFIAQGAIGTTLVVLRLMPRAY